MGRPALARVPFSSPSCASSPETLRRAGGGGWCVLRHAFKGAAEESRAGDTVPRSPWHSVLAPPMHMQEADAPLPPTWVAVHYLLLMRTLHLSFTGQIRSLLLFPFALRGHLNPGSLLRLNVPRLGEERARSSRACFSLNRRSLQGN